MIWAAPVSTIGKTGAPQFRSHHHADLTEHNASFALIYKFSAAAELLSDL
jgi:hypothetical protein